MLEYSETEQIVSQIERLCNEMSINKNMAFQYLADELAQIYILSKIDNPMYIRKNAEKLRENISLFDVEKKLKNWKELYGRTIRYKGEPIDSCSTEKWKTDLFSNQETQKCEYCKTKLTKELSEVDHYIPKDGGGLDQRSNFRISCNPCNNGKRQLSALFLFNTSITNASDLGTLKFILNGVNYTIYSSSLVLMTNFDNLSAIGENPTYFVDGSQYSNNGSCSN